MTKNRAYVWSTCMVVIVIRVFPSPSIAPSQAPTNSSSPSRYVRIFTKDSSGTLDDNPGNFLVSLLKPPGTPFAHLKISYRVQNFRTYIHAPRILSFSMPSDIQGSTACWAPLRSRHHLRPSQPIALRSVPAPSSSNVTPVNPHGMWMAHCADCPSSNNYLSRKCFLFPDFKRRPGLE